MITVKKFSATWCLPCKMLAPIFESQVKTAFAGVKFEDIDVDENPTEAQMHFVSSVPTVVVVKEGKEIARFSGVQSPMTYKNAINEAIK